MEAAMLLPQVLPAQRPNDILTPQNIVQKVSEILKRSSTSASVAQPADTRVVRLPGSNMSSSDLNYALRPDSEPYHPAITVLEIEALTQDQRNRGLSPTIIIAEKCMQDWLYLHKEVDWRLPISYNKFIERTAGRAIHPDIIAITQEYEKGRLMLDSNAYPNFFVRWYIWMRIEVYVARFSVQPELLRDTAAKQQENIGSGNREVLLDAKGTKNFSWMMDIPDFSNVSANKKIHPIDTAELFNAEENPDHNAYATAFTRLGRHQFHLHYGISDASRPEKKDEPGNTDGNTATQPRGWSRHTHHGLFYADYDTVTAWTPSKNEPLPPIRSILAGDTQYEYMDVRGTLQNVLRNAGGVLPELTLKNFRYFQVHMVGMGAIPVPLVYNGDLIELPRD